MPTRQVLIQGLMTWEEAPGTPPGIWGPTDPRPQPPIHLPPGGAPGYPAHPIFRPDLTPTPPIYYPPDGIWGGGNVPMPTPPIHLPGQPPGIWGPPGPWPTPPIHLPGHPPGIWGGGNVPMPTPPIANVPGAPGYNPNPPGIWGPPGPWPTPPIHLPPTVGLPPGGTPIPPAAGVPIDGKLVFVPGYGWTFIPEGAANGAPKPPEEPDEA